MNVTKNKVIEALNYLGEYPKLSLKKDELIEKLNEIYGKKIDELVVIINTKIYELIKRLVKADSNGIDVEKEDELEVDFLESTLIIEKPINTKQKIHIKFNEGMREKFIKFINNKNEDNVKKNQIIVDLIINIVDVYGIIQDYEMLDMLNKLLNTRMNINLIFALINYQIDLRNEIIIAESEEELYLMSSFINNPEEIIAERERRELYYREYTIQELEEKRLINLIDTKEAQEALKFLKKKEVKFAEEAIFAMIMSIMGMPQVDATDFMNLIKIDLEDIDEANEYLQLIMNLYNNIPHYALYGYSPNDLVKMHIEEQQKQELENKKKKIGRNEPCPCGSRQEI